MDKSKVTVDPKVGEFVWCLDWHQNPGMFLVNDDEAKKQRDWYLNCGKVVFVGHDTIVLEDPCTLHKKDFSVRRNTLIAYKAQDLMEFLRDIWKYDWVEEYIWTHVEERAKEDMEYCSHYWVFCSKHGGYDPDEICFKCDKEIRPLSYLW